MRPRAAGALAILAVALTWTGAAELAAAPLTLQEPTPESDTLAVPEWTLAEVLGLAVGQNRELAEARWAVRAAEARVREAWGAVLPRIDLTGTYTRNLSPPVAFLPSILFDPDGSGDEVVPVRFGADNAWDASLSLEQPIFEARALVGIGAAARFRRLSEERERGVGVRVTAELRGLYFDLLLAAEEHELLERSVERVEQTLLQTRALAAEGLASEYDVLRLEVEEAALLPEVEAARDRRRAAERELRVALGLDPDGAVVPVGALARMDLDRTDDNTPENRAILESFTIDPPAAADRGATVEELEARVRDGSPSVRALRTEQELRSSELRAEQVTWLPRLSLFGSYRVQAQQDGSPEFFASGPFRGYERWVGLRLSVPVFTGGQRVARIQERGAQLEAARLRTDRATDEAVQELHAALDAIRTARVAATAQELARARAARGYDMARAQFDEGLLSRLEFVDAEIALRETEQRYAAAVHAYLSARARLDALAGAPPGG